MPKMKTRRAAAKRFSLTAKGKVKIKKSNLRHILEKKSPKRKRNARQTAYANEADVNRIKRCIPYS